MIYVKLLLTNLAYFITILIRAALEKLSKEGIISLFFENDDKFNSNKAILTNQFAEVNKTLERVESPLQI